MSNDVICGNNLETLRGIREDAIQAELKTGIDRFNAIRAKLQEKGILGIRPQYNICNIVKSPMATGDILLLEMYEATPVTWKVLKRGTGGLIYKTLDEALAYLEGLAKL